MNLNKQQKFAKETILNFIKEANLNILLLGSAGTGKTTIISEIFNTPGLLEKTCFCAFTNKATNVLKNKLPDNANVCTIHLFLNLEPNVVTEKERDILKFKFDVKKVVPYKIVVLDECSTINKELFNYLEEAQYAYKMKYIFVGDYYQLPPIGEDKSEVFTRREDENWDTLILKRVMRSNNEFIYRVNRKCHKFIEKKLCEGVLIKDMNHLLPKNKFDIYEDYNNFIDKFIADENDKIISSNWNNFLFASD